MKARRNLGALSMATVAATLLLAPSARAGDDPPHRLGDHPAVVVQRLYKAAGYDYASKFYPHPAGLRLYAAPPRDGADGAPAAADGPLSGTRCSAVSAADAVAVVRSGPRDRSITSRRVED